MHFYRNEDLLKYKKNIKNTDIKLIALSVAAIILNVLFCLLIERVNYVLIQIINTCISTFCIFTIIYKLDTVILADVKKIKHYKEIDAAQKTEFCGTVKEIGNIITVNSGLKAREICLVADKKSCSFYLLENFERDFGVGDNVRLTIAKKYIVSSFIIEKSEKGSYA